MLDTALQERLEVEAAQLSRQLVIEAATVPEPVDVGQWVKGNLRAPDGPHEGKLYQPYETPYWDEVFECLSDEHPCTRVSVRKSAQLGYTVSVLVGWMGSVIDSVAGRSMIVQPTLNAARQFSEEKFEPVIEASRALRNKVLPKTQKSGDGSTALNKKFPGGSCRITGANSTADLRSKTLRRIGCDEVDEWALDLGEQGDPMGMVDARQLAFHKSGRFKKLEGSTPTIKGQSRIDAGFEAGDQRYYEVPCPHCGTKQALEWERLSYKETWPHKAEYECCDCHALIGHHEKMRMIRAGKWRAHKPGPGRYPSFHLNALYSPFTTWDRMVAAYLEAKDDPLKLKAWTNLWKGESFEIRGEAPGWQELKKRSDSIGLYELGEVPDEVLFVTAGADVQGNRIEVVVIGWGVGGTSYVLDYKVLLGQTNQLPVWQELTTYWNTTFRTKSGYERPIEMLAIDGNYRPGHVYNWVRGKEAGPMGTPRAMAVRGEPRRTDWVLGGAKKASFGITGKKKERGTALRWSVGSFAGKVHLYGQLGVDGPDDAGGFPIGFCHHPVGLNDDYYQQCVAEKLVPVPKRSGLLDYEWRLPPNQRNEVLDCRVYAYAAAEMLGVNKMTPEAWATLAAERTACAASEEQLDMLAGAFNRDGERKKPGSDGASLADKLA